MTEISERHRKYAGNFAQVIQRTPNWDAQSPVPDWKARDVVEHLLMWPAHLLREWVGIELADDPSRTLAQRWDDHSAGIQAILEGDQREQVLTVGPFQGQAIDDVIDRIYTGDLFMHTWDLAKSNNLDSGLDREYAAYMLEGMRQIESVLRGSGQYGPAKPTTSQDPVEQLMAFVGRETG